MEIIASNRNSITLELPNGAKCRISIEDNIIQLMSYTSSIAAFSSTSNCLSVRLDVGQYTKLANEISPEKKKRRTRLGKKQRIKP